MNKGYTCFGKYAYVYPKDKNRVIREYENNFDEILRQENIIEKLELIIRETSNTRDKIVKKNKYLKYSSGKSAWALYFIISLYFLAFTGPVSALICIIFAKFIIYFKRKKIKYFDNEIKGLNYKLLKSKKLLVEAQRDFGILKTKTDNKTIFNKYVSIDDSEILSKLERRLYLAYLYKLKEDIIQKNLVDNNLDILLNRENIIDEEIDGFSKDVLLEYALEKKKKLIKN